MTLLKSIVAVLVLANVSYFLWSRGVASTPEPTLATPSLQLASEVQGGMPQVGLPADAVAQAPGDAGPGSALPLVAAGAAVDSPMAATMAVPVGPASAAGNGSKRCVSVGPFRDVSEAARAAGTLRSSGHDPRQRVADGEIWAGVWVYLPVQPGPDAAEQLLDQLKVGGIDDALEMPGPNDSSVISLGLFSEPKRAQARVAQAQALSLTPVMTDRKRNGSVYWIDVDLKPSEPQPNPAEVQGESGHITRLEVKACPAASGPR